MQVIILIIKSNWSPSGNSMYNIIVSGYEYNIAFKVRLLYNIIVSGYAHSRTFNARIIYALI